MKNVYTVILIFSIFLVLGGGILAFGVWRKSAREEELRRRLDEADQVLDGTLQAFVKLGPGEQKALLSDARRLRRSLQADPRVPAEKVSDLGAWVADRLSLQAAVAQSKRELDGLKRELDNDLLRGGVQPLSARGGEPCEQLSAARAQRVRAVARRARDVGGRLTVNMGGTPVDLSPAIGKHMQTVQSAADTAIHELERREKAFALFVEGTEQALAGKWAAEIRNRTRRLDGWYPCVLDAAEKRRRLKELEMKLTYVDRRGEMEAVVQARIDGLLTAVTPSQSARQIQVVLAQCDEVDAAAKALVGLFPDSPVRAKIPAVGRARIDAMRRLQDLASRAQADKQRQGILEKKIVYTILPLLEDETRPKDEAEWNKYVAAKRIDEAIGDVKKIDPNAGFLTLLLAATKPKPKVPPGPPPVQWVGPNLEGLDANIKALAKLGDDCLARTTGGRTKYSVITTASWSQMSAKYKQASICLVRYVKVFAEFKKLHLDHLARKQAEEDKKARNKGR